MGPLSNRITFIKFISAHIRNEFCNSRFRKWKKDAKELCMVSGGSTAYSNLKIQPEPQQLLLQYSISQSFTAKTHLKAIKH